MMAQGSWFQSESNKNPLEPEVKEIERQNTKESFSADGTIHRQSTTPWLTDLRRDVIADLQSKRWVTGVLLCLLSLWILALLILQVLLASGFVREDGFTRYGGDGRFQGYSIPGEACQRYSTFDILRSRNIWGIEDFFQITMGAGALTFTEAKVIDVIWDTVVGRVGQALLAFFLWRAFSTYFTASISAKKDPITYNTYWFTFVDDNPTFISLYHITRDFFTTPSRRSNFAKAFIVISIVFVLAFPILASAMTGYKANSEAFVADPAGNLFPFSNLTQAAYTIHDGHRINLTDNCVVPFMLGGDPDPYYSYWNPIDDPRQYACTRPECGFAWEVSRYVEAYGFFGLDSKTGEVLNSDTVWMGKPLKRPALNISAFFFPQRTSYSYDAFFGNGWIDPRTNTSTFNDQRAIQMTPVSPVLSNITYSLDYIQSHGSCQPLDTYLWGFSFLQLFIALILLLVWTLTVLTMHQTARAVIRQRPKSSSEFAGKYHAAITLALSLSSALQDSGRKYEDLSKKELDRFIKLQLGGGMIVSQSDKDLPSTAYIGPWRLAWAWIKNNRMWAAALFLFGAFVHGFVIWVFTVEIPFYHLILVQYIGLIFALSVGRTSKSRLFFTFSSTLVAAVIFLAIFLGFKFGWM
ncbi:hypothetical protein B0H66DRAFT_504169 [Apodospora peruviana]|uniref:Uncharacterized protein n=1 Tax=Apodospora peruviana TaxID=516989 RepID=A0AAE0HWN2_9PEZI|nr:hypothetical protein B0H66DRAFT_504169 [Apodospora peruviana]